MNATDPHAEHYRAYRHYCDHGVAPNEADELATKYVAEQQAEKKPAKRTSTLKVLLVVGGVFAGLILFLAFAVPAMTPSDSTEPKGDGTPVVTTQSAPESASPTPAAVPVPADFVLEVVTLRKQCFGSAGCNVTFQLKPPSYSGPVLADDQEFTVIYEVTGDESGPLTNTFTLRGSNVEYASEESVSTKSAGVVITAKVTQVLPG